MKLKELVAQYGEYDVGLIETPKGQESEWARIHLFKPKPKSVWELEHGDEYVRITGTGGVSECEVCTKITYDRQRDIGNVFLTREDAEKDTERRKVETLLLKYGGRRWYKKSRGNYALKTDDLNRLTINYLTYIQGTIFFDTKEQAEKAIEEIGAERIKNALFEVR